MFFEEKAKKEGSMLPDETASPRKIQNVSEIASVQEKTATKKETAELKKRIRDRLPGNTDSKVTIQRSFAERFSEFFRKRIQTLRNPHYFLSVTELYSKIIQVNRNVISIQPMSRTDYIMNDFTTFNESLDDLDKFYYEFKKKACENPHMELMDVYRKFFADTIERHQDGTESIDFPGLMSHRSHEGSSYGSGSDYDDDEEGGGSRVVGKKHGKKNISIAHKDRDLIGTVTVEKPVTILEVLVTIVQIILSNWTLFLYFNLIIYHLTRQGLLTLFIPYTIFGYALCEEIKPRYSIWRFIFTGISMIMIIRFFTSTFTDILGEEAVRFLNYLTGETNTFRFEIWLLVVVVIQIVLNQEIGFEEKAEMNFENVNLAFVRKKLNNDLKKVFDEQQDSDSEDDTPQEVKDALPGINLKVNLQQLAQNSDIHTEIEKKFAQDLDRFTIQDLSKNTFRFFSYHNKKIGRDIYPYIAGIQIILAVYILFFYSSMESGGFSSPGSSLQFNQFSGSMVVVLFIQIGFILWDRRIIMLNNGIRDRKKQAEEAGEMKEDEKPKKHKFLENKSSNNASKKKSQSKSKKKSSGKEKDKKNDPLEAGLIEQLKGGLGISISATQKVKEEPYWQYSGFNKYILLILLMVLVHVFIYYHLVDVTSLNTGTKTDIVNLTSNTPATLFYILYCLYFTFSAFQVKYGIPYFKGKNYLMNQANTITNSAFTAYRALPFIFEIRTFMDWTFTKTALDLFQWIKFEIIFSTLFLAKCKWISKQKHQVGAPIALLMKIIQGGIAIIGLILIIFGPLLIFSTLNPFLTVNPVTGTSVTVGLRIDSNYYNIFSASHVSSIVNATDATFASFGSQSVLTGVDKSTVQVVTMALSSDTNWDIAAPSRDNLEGAIDRILDDMKSGRTVNETVNLIMEYSFIQSISASTGSSPTKLTQTFDLLNSTTQNSTNSLGYIQALYDQLSCDSNSVLYVPQFYKQLIRMAPQATPISYSGDNNEFFRGVYIKLTCDNGSTYWTMGLSTNVTDVGVQIQEGISFYTISNKIFKELISFSVSTFYLGVVYVLGQNLRSTLTNNQLNVQYLDVPKADNLLQICEGILIARADLNLEKEEMLYWELIDLCRSPEVFKKITDSCVSEMRKKKMKTD